jgi:hypothetical protein
MSEKATLTTLFTETVGDKFDCDFITVELNKWESDDSYNKIYTLRQMIRQPSKTVLNEIEVLDGEHSYDHKAIRYAIALLDKLANSYGKAAQE